MSFGTSRSIASCAALLLAVACGGAPVAMSDDPSASSTGTGAASDSPASSTGTGAASDLGVDCPEASTRDVVLVTPTGQLHGTLELPAGCGAFPVALIHAGSGPTDRDGNSLLLPGRNDSLKLLAHGLAERGIASVRYDKRGVAASFDAEPNEADLRFETYAADAAMWAEGLAADPRFAGVTFIGHSEGSLIGMLAAKDGLVVAFVSLAGAGRKAGDALRWQLAEQLPAPLLEQAYAIIASLEAGETVDVQGVDPLIAELFRPSVQPYLISWFKYDPAAELASLGIPAAIVQGTTDDQVLVEDALLLAAADPEAQLTIVEGMNHVLKEAPPGLEGYTDPSLPVMPAVFDAIVARIDDADQ